MARQIAPRLGEPRLATLDRRLADVERRIAALAEAVQVLAGALQGTDARSQDDAVAQAARDASALLVALRRRPTW